MNIGNICKFKAVCIRVMGPLYRYMEETYP